MGFTLKHANQRNRLKIIDLWKEYCGKVNVFTTAQFTADALMEAMNITV